MIYLTGDTHGEIDIGKLSLSTKSGFLQEGDYLIITGDFGFPFTPNDIEIFEKHNKTEDNYNWRMKWFSELPYKVLFVDGNHDNHDWWAKQEITEMWGGKVQIHPHSSNVIHLMRGEIYTIEEKTFFTFGGATSIDKGSRIIGYSWWPGEDAQRHEIDNAVTHLEKKDYKVDYIITHTLPMSVIKNNPIFGNKIYPCNTASFLNYILSEVQYKRWFCGHFHIDKEFSKERINILYNDFIGIDEKKRS